MNISYKYRGFITALLAALLLLSSPEPEFEIFAVPIFVIAVFLRVWARTHIGMHSRGNKLSAPQVVKTGPYSFFNHPLYLSNWLAGVSFALLHSGFSAMALLFCLTYLVYMLLLSIRENLFLSEIEAYVPQIQVFKPQIKDVFKAVLNDKWTWFWQLVFIALIFIRKNYLL